VRKLATALAVSIALSSGSVHALSLGEIEMRSALNQPMSAEIQLSSVRADEMNGMIVKLASPEAFARAGIERTDSLADLKFEINKETRTIMISSRRPIVEPFLNFLLEVEWPAGRMVREYTVLLDPPVFMSPNTSSRVDTGADSPALVQRDDNSLVTPTPIQREGELVGDGELISLDALDTSIDSGVGETVSLDALDTTVETTVVQTDVAIVDEDPAVARARAAGAAARAAINAGEVIPSTGGEIITLETLGTDAGEVVTLSDLNAPNTAAQAEIDLNDGFDVELVGVGSESTLQADGSEIVSLDDLGTSVGTAVEITESDTQSITGTVTVQRGDTLGVIAENLAGNGASAQQMMMALLAANESAFINGNINLVKAGAELRIPSANEARSLSQAQALASISDQNRLWQEYRDSVRSGQRATQVATASQAASTAASTSSSQTESASNTAELGADAAAILENARTEVLRREELSIVADNESTTTAASATSDESSDSDSNRLGEINRKLQLAREELASSRRETDDLTDQSNALQSTSENIDTLVSLQQNDIAKLEAQLEAAKAETTAESATASAEALAAAAAESTGEALSTAADNATDAAAGLAGAATDLVGGAADSAGDTASNALASAGEALESVELVGGDAATAATDAASNAAATAASAATNTVAGATEASKGFLDTFLGSNLKWLLGGVGGLALFGLGGTLLLKRRKNKDIDDAELDDVEFLDEMDAADGTGAHAVSSMMDSGVDAASNAASAGVGAVAAGGAAAAAAVGMGGLDNDDTAAPAPAAMEADDDLMGAADAFESAESAADDMDHDDTISEVDVYLAYGLHGQAEELLTKAIDRDGNNPEYQTKLLETHAAQGNSDAYGELASQFHQKFGGSHEAWAGIAARGLEIDPGNDLFAGAAGDVEAVGVGRFDEAPSLQGEDFAVGDESEAIESMSRGFGGASDDAQMAAGTASDDDETHLMDQSIDPAFAFDEADLEGKLGFPITRCERCG